MMGSSEETAPGNGAGKKNGKRKAVAALLLLLLAVSAAALAYVAWDASKPVEADSGAVVSTYDGMTKEEIQAELDRKTKESRMTMSVSAVCKLADGKARVNVVNAEDNRFAQSFTLEQGGKVLYESGRIDPGQGVEWCDAPGAEAGDAKISIQAIDRDTGKRTGAAQSIQVTLVEASGQ